MDLLGTLGLHNASREQLVHFEGRAVSTADLWHEALRWAGEFERRGVRPGDRVGLWMVNRPELMSAYLACFATGAIAMPINNRFTESEASTLIDHGTPKLLLSEPELLGRFSQDPGMPTIDVTSLEPGDPLSELPALPDGAPATLLYTSGTTGEPKGTIHTRTHLINNVRNQHELVRHGPDDVTLLFLSMCHTFGLLRAWLPSLSAGSTIVLQRQYDPLDAVAALGAFPVSLMYGLPAMYTLILQELDRRPEVDLVGLRNAMVAGDAVPIALHEHFQRRAGIQMDEEYALTETMMVAANRVLGEKVIGSMGLPLPGMQVRLVDHSGDEVGPGGIGEIVVRGNTVMQEYFRNPSGTSDSFLDGWFRTGDLGAFDEQGDLWFKGRIKQIIVHNGSNISPVEVEAAFYKHPDVLEVAVVGVPDAISGQRLVSFVAVRPGSQLTAKTLDDFVATYLARYQVPEEIHMRPHLPKGVTGKIDHAQLLAEYESAQVGASAHGPMTDQ